MTLTIIDMLRKQLPDGCRLVNEKLGKKRASRIAHGRRYRARCSLADHRARPRQSAGDGRGATPGCAVDDACAAGSRRRRVQVRVPRPVRPTDRPHASHGTRSGRSCSPRCSRLRPNRDVLRNRRPRHRIARAGKRHRPAPGGLDHNGHGRRGRRPAHALSGRRRTSRKRRHCRRPPRRRRPPRAPDARGLLSRHRVRARVAAQFTSSRLPSSSGIRRNRASGPLAATREPASRASIPLLHRARACAARSRPSRPGPPMPADRPAYRPAAHAQPTPRCATRCPRCCAPTALRQTLSSTSLPGHALTDSAAAVPHACRSRSGSSARESTTQSAFRLVSGSSAEKTPWATSHQASLPTPPLGRVVEQRLPDVEDHRCDHPQHVRHPRGATAARSRHERHVVPSGQLSALRRESRPSDVR